jgi:hypothetical protein
MSRTELAGALLAAGLIGITSTCSQGASAKATQPPASGCVLIAGGAPADSTSLTENVRTGRRYQCTLHTGGPVIEAALIADSAENTIARIELRHPGESKPFQTLTEGQDESPYRGADFFAGRDLDNDGYLDLLLLNSWGATGNTFYQVWRWSAKQQRFAFDSTLSSISSPSPIAGRPCVRTHTNAGDAGLSYEAATLCLEDGHWVRVASESQHRDTHLNAYLRETRERRGNAMAVIRLDTIRDSTP